MLIIKHLQGPLAGQKQNISDDHTSVLIGRDAKCEIRYPAEETSVGHEHCRLEQQASGDWVIERFGDHYVEIDGISVDLCEPIHTNAVIRLGTHKGPSFQISIEKKTESFDKTALQDRTVPVIFTVRHYATAGICALILIILAAGGVFYFNASKQQKLEQRLAQFADNQEKIEKDQKANGKNAISPTDQARLNRAAFLVILRDKQGRETAEGTAWPVGPNLLGTNAHITEARTAALKGGETMFVRAPGLNGSSYEVIEHVTHPGYFAFKNYVEGHDTIRAVGYHGIFETLPWEDATYDVGLLRVAEQLPSNSILEIAPIEELKALATGMPLASEGYPVENIVGADVESIAATPELHFGNITAITDYFSLPTDASEAHLIHHSIGITGGSSGSPILGTSGHVIALVNAGNFLFDANGNRTPNAALINYAQRADILADLITGKAEAALEVDRLYWDRQLAELQAAGFKRGIDVLIPWILDKNKPSIPGSKPVMVSEEKGVLGASDLHIDTSGKSTTTRYRMHEQVLTLQHGANYVMIAYAEGSTPIELFLSDKDNKILAQDVGKLWYPSVTYTPEQDGDIYAYVEGPDEDTNYVFRLYRWDSPPS
jgi:hypothetical protein